MSWIKDRFNEILNPFSEKDSKILTQEEDEKERNIYCIQFDKDVYWLPSPITVPKNFDSTNACLKILCERTGFEKITQEEKAKRMKEIREKELKETEENKDGTE